MSTDRRTSREIIWQLAFDYHWRRWQDINANPGVDAFQKTPTDSVPYPDAPELIVWYSRDGRTVVDCTWRGNRLYRHRRDDVMDILEGHR
jgi:hypothetical protein